MPATELPTLADQLRKLPVEGAARQHQLYRLIDLQASAQAAAALHAAAARARSSGDLLSAVLTTADAVVSGSWDAVVRDRLREAVTSAEFAAALPRVTRELREVASLWPESGACTVATAMRLWSWSLNYFRTGEGSRVESARQAIDELAEAFCQLLAARCLVLDATAKSSPATPADAEFRIDIAHVQSARASSLVAAACAELVFGYRRHLLWDAEGCATCYGSDELDDLEAIMPGIASGARTSIDVIEGDGSHPSKRGPCVKYDGVDMFMRLRSRLDGCLTGVRIAKDRAAAAIACSAASTEVRA